jgi:hypothetical protein
MVKTGNNSTQRRQRTKQTLSAPRHVLKEAAQEMMEKLVWVTVGKTEHQAWLLEEIGEGCTVLVRWESTGIKERVPVLLVRHNMPRRRSSKTITMIFNYDERVEAEEKRKSSSKKRGGRAQPGHQKRKASKKVAGEAMSAPRPASDDIDNPPNDSSQELKKNLHLEQECSISAQHENSKMDDIPSPTMEVTIIRPKKHQRSSGPKKKKKREDFRDDEPSMSAPPRGFEVDLTKIQEEELSSGRASYLSDMHKSSNESDSSDDEADMRRIAKRMTRKIPRRSHQTENGGGPRSSVVARVSASSGDDSSEDEYSIPALQADADLGGSTVQSSKHSDSDTETKSWSVALTSGAMDFLMQALQDDIGKIVCSFESKGESNLHQLANASTSPCHGVVKDTSCTRPNYIRPLPLHTPTLKACIVPHRFDVLFGTGTGLREHTGNVHANRLVASYRPQYDKADKQEKTDITWHIVKIIHESYDGRFMKFEENEGWVEVEPGMAREKISHIFRNQRIQTRRNHRAETSIGGIEMQKLPSSRSHLSPSTGVVVPTSVASANTVPGFLDQLTKMLSDSNGEVIEWSHDGESKSIVIPGPMTFRVCVMPTFEFSRPQAR